MPEPELLVPDPLDAPNIAAFDPAPLPMEGSALGQPALESPAEARLSEEGDRELPVMPPCNLDSDEPPLESDLHLQQIILFLECLNWLWRDRTDYYASGNLTIYYSTSKIKTRDFRGPDFFVVLNTEKRPRKSWTVWEEDGKTPNVIIEILSNSTAQQDRGAKKQLYQDVLRVFDYFWFDPVTLEFAGFTLVGGQYQPLQPGDRGWLWSEQLQLFLGIQDRRLRFFTPDGVLVPTPAEVALQEQQRAEQLAAKLRELGIDPDAL